MAKYVVRVRLNDGRKFTFDLPPMTTAHEVAWDGLRAEGIEPYESARAIAADHPAAMADCYIDMEGNDG